MEKQQIIKCRIESCIHNRPDHRCSLGEINVSPCGACGCSTVKEKEQSMCASFAEKQRGFF